MNAQSLNELNNNICDQEIGLKLPVQTLYSSYIGILIS